MSELPPEMQAQLNDIGMLVQVHAQDKALKRACGAGPGIQQLFDYFSDVRDGQEATEISNFNELIDACKELFLVLAAPESRPALLETATQYAVDTASDVIEVKPIAAADLILRKLEILCIESAANKYPGETRSAGWDSKISEMQSTLSEVEGAWRSRHPSAE